MIVYLYLYNKSQTAPTPLNLKEVSSQIVYPDSAKKNNIEGKIIIKVLVDENGNVVEIGGKEINDPHILYNEAARVSWNLKFSPAYIFKRTTKCWVSVPFNFKLKDKPTE